MDGPFRVGVDIDGTFNDLLAMDEHSGRTFVLKQSSTASPVEAVVEGIRELAVRHNIGGRVRVESRRPAQLVRRASTAAPRHGRHGPHARGRDGDQPFTS
jgi:N-methylhydantoinase A/oxoprolinase/acetone carboxylase beta subunit